MSVGLKPIFKGEYIAFSPFDQIALAELIRRVARPGSRMVEVGSWLGNGSTQVFLKELGSMSGTELLCVDTWQGSVNVQRHLDIVAEYDVYGTFLENVAQAPASVKLTPLRLDSTAAAETFDNRSLDFVFIDADHSYEAVKADIAAWRPKVRPGGILCGHDCEIRVTHENRAILSANSARDTVEINDNPFRHVHPGSALAVNEAFGDSVGLWAETALVLPGGTPGRSSIWWVLQGKRGKK